MFVIVKCFSMLLRLAMQLQLQYREAFDRWWLVCPNIERIFHTSMIRVAAHCGAQGSQSNPNHGDSKFHQGFLVTIL